MLWGLLLAAAEPSAPPLVPIQDALPEVEPVRAPAEPEAEEPAPSTRSERLVGTTVGAVVGNLLTGAAWFLQLLVFGGACGSGCLPIGAIVTGVGTLIGLAPIGPFIGHRAARGEAPYWKFVLGTAAGTTLAAVTAGIFESIGFFRTRDSGPAIGAAISVSVLLVLLGQIAVPEIGVSDPSSK